jgi:hypothetical protein
VAPVAGVGRARSLRGRLSNFLMTCSTHQLGKLRGTPPAPPNAGWRVPETEVERMLGDERGA